MNEQIEKLAVILGEEQWKDSFYGNHVANSDRERCRMLARIVLNAGYRQPAQVREQVVFNELAELDVTVDCETPTLTKSLTGKLQDESIYSILSLITGKVVE